MTTPILDLAPQADLPAGVRPRSYTTTARTKHAPTLGPDVEVDHADGTLLVYASPNAAGVWLSLRHEGHNLFSWFVRSDETVVHPADLGCVYTRHGMPGVTALKRACSPHTASVRPPQLTSLLASVDTALSA